jgi:hypothetical protein
MFLNRLFSSNKSQEELNKKNQKISSNDVEKGL